MSGGGRPSFRGQLAEGRAAVASWQVDFKKGLTKGELREGEFSYHNRRFNHVQLKFLGLAKRRVALDGMNGLMHQLDQLKRL